MCKLIVCLDSHESLNCLLCTPGRECIGLLGLVGSFSGLPWQVIMVTVNVMTFIKSSDKGQKGVRAPESGRAASAQQVL